MTDLTTAPVASDIEDNDITMLVRVVNGVDTLYQVPASVIRGEQGPQGIQGEQGPQGIQGTKGSTWYFGIGSPPSTLTPILNDMYYDTNNCDIYNYNSENKWIVIGNIRGLQGIQGDAGSKWYIGDGPPILSNISDYDLYMDYGTGNVYQYLNGAWSLTNINLIGPKGDQGPQGIQGQIGSQWYYGSGSPTLTSVNKNDMYLDTNTSNIYSFNSVWTKVGNIKGLQGQIGSQWYTGAGLPVSNSSYSINDFYLNNLTSDVYHYTSTGWVKVANIQGQQGIQGEQGPQGDQGIQGSIWYYGNVSPPTIIPRNYDLYLNGLNGDVYQYISSVWVDIGNIRGAPGTLSSDGTDDIKINDATLYNSGSISFSSNGDNTTIDSVLSPSGGTAGTPYQGTLTVESNIFSIKNQFNSDQGNIKSDGNGDLSVKNLTINGIKAATTSDLTNYAKLAGGNIITGEQHFALSSFSDPDIGSARDAKFGQNGIAVIGGTKTDILTVTGKSSLDNGKIITDGSGTLTIMNGKQITIWPSATWVPGVVLHSSGPSTFKITDTSGADGILSCGNIISSGNTSLDNGAITTDGSGNLTTSGLLNAKSPNDVPGTSTSNNVATTNWIDSNYVALSKATTQTINGPITFSSKTLVPNVDDWTSNEAIPAVQADGRYARDGAVFNIGENTNTNNSNILYGSACRLSFQDDNNLVIYDTSSNSAIFQLSENSISWKGNNLALDNEKVNRSGDSMTGHLWNTSWISAGANGGWNGARTNTGDYGWTNGIEVGNPTNNGAYRASIQITDVLNNGSSNTSGINFTGYDSANNTYQWYLAWNGNIQTPKGLVAFESDLSNLQNQINNRVQKTGDTISWLQVSGATWTLGNSSAVYNSAVNRWTNSYVDSTGNATWDLNGGSPSSNSGNLSWLRMASDGSLQTSKGVVAFQSDLPLDANQRIQSFSVSIADGGSITFPVAFSGVPTSIQLQCMQTSSRITVANPTSDPQAWGIPSVGIQIVAGDHTQTVTTPITVWVTAIGPK